MHELINRFNNKTMAYRRQFIAYTYVRVLTPSKYTICGLLYLTVLINNY